MRRVALFITCLFALNLFLIPANSAVKYGEKCGKAGQTAIASGKKFTCTKSGKKLIWNKGVVVSKPVASPTPAGTTTITSKPAFEFKTFCDLDPEVPEAWKAFQENLSRFQCAPPYRYVVKELTTITPSNMQTDRNKILPVASCKLERSANVQAAINGNYLLNPNISIMVVPFASTDFPSEANPQTEWGPYFAWIKSSLENMTDVGSNYRIEVAPKYFKISKKLTEYKLSGEVSHGDSAATDRRYELINDVIKVADPEINFSGFDYVFFVTPRSVPRSVLSNQIAYGRTIVTNEKTFGLNGYITSYIDDFKSPYWISREPFGFIHEMMHIFGTAEDYYGDADYGGNDVGAGNWGNMSRAMTDHLVWDKWTAKMVSDNQIRCAAPNETSVHWIKPSTVKGEYEKLLLVRLNEFEAIGVESFRNSGFNYKLPKAQHGAVVYLLNTKDMDDYTVHGDGLKVYCPDQRPCTSTQDSQFGGFKLALAALKPGEFVTLKGVRISVIEAGDFGDVVKVEKA